MRWLRSPGLLLIVPAVALATTFVPRSLAERAAEADRVVLAQVLSSATVIEGGDPKHMKTITELSIGVDYKGFGPSHVQLVQWGGSSGGWELKVPGDATLLPGETALMFLRCSAPGRCALLGLGQGHLQLVDGQLLVPDLKTSTFSKQPLSAVLKALQLKGVK